MLLSSSSSRYSSSDFKVGFCDWLVADKVELPHRILECVLDGVLLWHYSTSQQKREKTVGVLSGLCGCLPGNYNFPLPRFTSGRS